MKMFEILNDKDKVEYYRINLGSSNNDNPHILIQSSKYEWSGVKSDLNLLSNTPQEILEDLEKRFFEMELDHKLK